MSRPFGAPVGVTTWFLHERGPSALRWAHTQGFSHVHFDRGDLVGQDLGAFRALSEDFGLALGGLSVAELESCGVTGYQARDRVKLAAAEAVALGVDYLYLPSFGAARMRTRHDISATAELLRYALAVCRPEGLTVATENDLSAPELTQLFSLVADDELELLFDTQNLSIRGVDPLAVIELHSNRVRRFVHVKDGTTGLGDARLGSGNARVGESLRALQMGGFRGVFVIESDFRSASPSAVSDDQTRLSTMTMYGDSGSR